MAFNFERKGVSFDTEPKKRNLSKKVKQFK